VAEPLAWKWTGFQFSIYFVLAKDVSERPIRSSTDSIEGMDTSTLEIAVQNQYPEIERVKGLFFRFSEQHGIPDPVKRAFILAFDELLNNIISYGFPKIEDRSIAITVRLGKTTVRADIVDSGVPFNILETPLPNIEAELPDRPTGGLGIFLVRQVMDEIQYRREGDCNRTTLIKFLGNS
jgi:anti-sigma regulatory factor (Ser/Thr protein kinase)